MLPQIILIQLVILPCLTLQKIQPSTANKTDASSYYDQRQTGKYNINVNIKDVAFISLEPENLSANLGDSGSFYEDYYDYDLDDFTISPIAALLGGGSPSKPSSTTLKPLLLNTTDSKPIEIPSTIASSTLTTPAPTIATKTTPKTQNVVIMNEDKPLAEIPVQVIMEPLLKPKIRARLAARRPSAVKIMSEGSSAVDDDESRVVRIRPRTASQNCHRGQVRDRQGRCRNRRSELRRVMDLIQLLTPKENETQ